MHDLTLLQVIMRQKIPTHSGVALRLARGDRRGELINYKKYVTIRYSCVCILCGYFGSEVEMWSTWQITFCATLLVVFLVSTSLAAPRTLQQNGYKYLNNKKKKKKLSSLKLCVKTT